MSKKDENKEDTKEEDTTLKEMIELNREYLKLQLQKAKCFVIDKVSDWVSKQNKKSD